MNSPECYNPAQANLEAVITELQQERDRLDKAIRNHLLSFARDSGATAKIWP